MSYGYESPPPSPYGAGSNSGLAESKVAGPAIAMIVIAALGIMLQIFNLLLNIFAGGLGGVAATQGGGEEAIPLLFQAGIGIAGSVLGIIFGAVIIFGALKMKGMRSYGFAMAAAVMIMLPCISPCCILGMPVGLWALITLNDDQVKGSFRG